MKISIITASYNYEDLIVTAIDSVINQSHKDWELIIVDDGSKDNSVKVIQEYVEKYDNIKLFQHENGINKGLKETVKFALEKCTGEYVAFLESDDYWESNNLEEKVKIIEKDPNINFIFNDVNLIGTQECKQKLDNHFKVTKRFLDQKQGSRNLFQYFFLINLVPTFSCVMAKKEILDNVDFDTPIDALLDLWLWTQLSFANKFYYLDKKLTNWMLHDDSYLNSSSDVRNKSKQKLFYSRIFNRIESTQKPSIFLFLKLGILKLAKIERIDKIFRGLIKKLLLMMEYIPNKALPWPLSCFSFCVFCGVKIICNMLSNLRSEWII